MAAEPAIKDRALCFFPQLPLQRSLRPLNPLPYPLKSFPFHFFHLIAVYSTCKSCVSMR